MRFAQAVTGSAWFEWLKFLVPSGLLGTLGAFIGWRGLFRPALARFVFYLMRTKEGQLLFREYFGETMDGLNVELATTTSAVRTMQPQLAEYLRTQGELKNIVGQLATAIDRLALALARIDGATEERRYSAHHNPRRRADD
jgi:hypothetical protein